MKLDTIQIMHKQSLSNKYNNIEKKTQNKQQPKQQHQGVKQHMRLS